LENLIRKEFSVINKEISTISSKMDICLINQEKLNHFLLPGEKIIKKPPNFSSLPVNTEAQLNCLENFLRNDGNLSATVSVFAILFYYFTSLLYKRVSSLFCFFFLF